MFEFVDKWIRVRVYDAGTFLNFNVRFCARPQRKINIVLFPPHFDRHLIGGDPLDVQEPPPSLSVSPEHVM